MGDVMNFTDVNGLNNALDAAVALYELGFTPIKAVGKKPDGTAWQKTKYTSKEEVIKAFENWRGRRDVYIDEVDVHTNTTKKVKKNWPCTVGVLTDGYYLLGNNTQEALDAFKAECPFYDDTTQRMGRNPYRCALFKRASNEPLKKTKLIRKIDTGVVDEKTKKNKMKYITLCDLWADAAHFVAWGLHPDDETIRYKFMNDKPPMVVSDEYIFDLIDRVAKRLSVDNPYEKNHPRAAQEPQREFDLFGFVKEHVRMTSVLGTNATRIMCPMHTQGSSNPSAVIYDDREIHCHSNGCHADVISMYAHLQGWDVSERGVMFRAAQALAEQYDLDIPEHVAAARPMVDTEDDLADQIHQYVRVCLANGTQPDRMRIVSLLANFYDGRENFITYADTQEILSYSETTGTYLPNGEQHIRRSYQEFINNALDRGIDLSKYTTIATINEIVDTIRRRTMRQREDAQPPPNLVCLANCILDVNTMQTSPFTPEHCFTSKLAVRHDPTATCPEIDKFLKGVVKETDIKIIEEVAGICLIREDKLQKAVCMIGEGSNGKSTLIRLFTEFLGHENITSVSLQELETDKFAVANLYGKHANLVADMSGDDLKGTAKFKACTGGDTVRAQNKNGQPFFFINHAKFIISCNRLPKSPDGSMAFFRRILILHFTHSFEGTEDRNILQRITTPSELSGFLNRAIVGYHRLQTNNQYSYNGSSSQVRELYIHLSDSAAAFCMDKLEPNEEEEGIAKQEIWNRYLLFCKENKFLRMAERPFWESVYENFMTVEYRQNKETNELRPRMLKGVKLKPKTSDVKK